MSTADTAPSAGEAARDPVPELLGGLSPRPCGWLLLARALELGQGGPWGATETQVVDRARISGLEAGPPGIPLCTGLLCCLLPPSQLALRPGQPPGQGSGICACPSRPPCTAEPSWVFGPGPGPRPVLCPGALPEQPHSCSRVGSERTDPGATDITGTPYHASPGPPTPGPKAARPSARQRRPCSGFLCLPSSVALVGLIRPGPDSQNL